MQDPRSSGSGKAVVWQTRAYDINVAALLAQHQLTCAQVRLTAIALRVYRPESKGAEKYPEHAATRAGTGSGSEAARAGEVQQAAVRGGVGVATVLGAVAVSAEPLWQPVVTDLAVQLLDDELADNKKEDEGRDQSNDEAAVQRVAEVHSGGRGGRRISFVATWSVQALLGDANAPAEPQMRERYCVWLAESKDTQGDRGSEPEGAKFMGVTCRRYWHGASVAVPGGWAAVAVCVLARRADGSWPGRAERRVCALV